MVIFNLSRKLYENHIKTAYLSYQKIILDYFKPGKLFFWLGHNDTLPQNLGDFLSFYFFKKLYSSPQIPNNTVMMIIGSAICNNLIKSSLLEYRKVIFYSCGARSNQDGSDAGFSPEYRNNKRVKILGVRGPLSGKFLNKKIIGDLGLIMPFIYNKPNNIKEYSNKLVFVPHYFEKRESSVILNETGCDTILDIKCEHSLEAVELFIDKLTSAKFILSASLHGCILAYAYGIDFAFYDSGENIDCPFKWNDFAAYLEKECVFYKTANEAMESSWYKNLKKSDLTLLVSNSPFTIKKGIIDMRRLNPKYNIYV